MRPMAANAALRPAQNSSRSASEFDFLRGGRAAGLGDRLDPFDQVIDLARGPSSSTISNASTSSG